MQPRIRTNLVSDTRTVLLLAVSLAVGAHSGTFSYLLHNSANPTTDETDAYARITVVMDSATKLYGSLTSLSKSLDIYYEPTVQTADGSSNGSIRFGASRSYMVVATALHEMAHTLGVGTTAEWTSLIQGGVFVGPAATAKLREIHMDPAVKLNGDAQHFWPHGLNYASEAKTYQDLVDHCRIVDAIVQDLFHERVWMIGTVRSRSTGLCMVRRNLSLALGSCSDSAAKVRIVAMGTTDTTYRFEWGDKVLDIPNESRQAGVAAGLYSWGGGGHQKISLEPQATGYRLRMAHSGLYLRAGGTTILQDGASIQPSSQIWEFPTPDPTGVEGSRKETSQPKERGTWTPAVHFGSSIRVDASGRR